MGGCCMVYDKSFPMQFDAIVADAFAGVERYGQCNIWSDCKVRIDATIRLSESYFRLVSG
jgi:hypothetical protein